MASIALIGPDGAGKTTLTRMLQRSGVMPFRYLYMGICVSSSNVALPSSRLVERLRARKRTADAAAARRAAGSRGVAHGFSRAVWAAARLSNRVAEEWSRQILSWYYQLRGEVVLYDRHFVFDFAPEITGEGRVPFDVRLHRWLLAKFYPHPTLVIFLDAPGELLFARKGELSAHELERRRQAFLRQSTRIRNFIRIDATRPLDEVYEEVVARIVAQVGRPAMASRKTAAGAEAPRVS